MIQCEQCEFFRRSEDGEISFRCDPFRNVKEPECLAKWQLIKINQMVAAYQATLDYYRKLAPMQEKMFKVMEREIDEMNEGEKWRIADDEDEEDADERGGSPSF
jgi:CRISPR/Cas system CSM-associated protein Csm2 small subunit